MTCVVVLFVLAQLVHVHAFEIFAYVPEYRFNGLDFARLGQLATHIGLFSIDVQQDGRLSDVERLTSPVLRRARESGAEVVVTVGGGGRGQFLGQVLHTARLRQTLVNSLAELVRREKLSGIDLDWPALRNSADVAAVEAFFDALRTETTQEMRLSMTRSGSSPELTAELVRCPHIDYVHLMAYDMCAMMPCKHATKRDASRLLSTLARLGAPMPKVLLGIPAYGRDMQNPSDARTYSELVDDNLLANTESDETSDGKFFLNSPVTVESKTKEMRLRNGGGVFLWEAGQDKMADDKLSLLAAMRRGSTEAQGKEQQNGDADGGKSEL